MRITRRNIISAGATTFALASMNVQTAASEGQTGTTPVTKVPFKIAAIQAESVYLDLKGGIEKTVDLIGKAAAQGASLVAFPELWLPGYPFGHEGADWREARLKTYVENSLVIGGEEWKILLSTAKKNNIIVSVGYSERDVDHLFIGQALIGSDGNPIQIRRKLRPSGGERTVWSDSDASGLKVFDTPLGRIGSLSCWEHMHPQMTYIMQAQMENVHIGAWPVLPEVEGFAWAGPKVNLASARYYATLTNAVTVVPCGVVGDLMFGEFQKFSKSLWVPKGGGYARIFGANGLEISESLAPTEEGIVMAAVDPSEFSRKAYDSEGEFSYGVLNFIHENYPGPRVPDQDHSQKNMVSIRTF